MIRGEIESNDFAKLAVGLVDQYSNRENFEGLSHLFPIKRVASAQPLEELWAGAASKLNDQVAGNTVQSPLFLGTPDELNLLECEKYRFMKLGGPVKGPVEWCKPQEDHFRTAGDIDIDHYLDSVRTRLHGQELTSQLIQQKHKVEIGYSNNIT